MLRLKAASTTRLIEADLHPLRECRDPETGKYPRCWSQGGWKVYLDSVEDILRSIRYVEDNPLKEGKPRQSWQCVTLYQAPFV